MKGKTILLYDGVCNLCHGAVRFILRHEEKPQIMFCALQSTEGEELLKEFERPKDLDSMILLEDNQIYWYSDAALRISRYLKFPWNLIWHFRWVPRSLRNFVYKSIAKSRYTVFGKKDACRLPTAAERTRFLDA